MIKYPCKNCIIKLQCVELCNKTMKHGIFKFFIDNGRCPDCGHFNFRSVFARFPVSGVHYAFQCADCETIYSVNYDHHDENQREIMPTIKRILGKNDRFGQMSTIVGGIELAKVLSKNFKRY